MDKDEVFLPSAQVKRRYNVTDMSPWRWLHDAELGFPQPIEIGGRRYWRLSELQRFETLCAVRRSERQRCDATVVATEG
jgi:hypothetical protein